MKSLRLTFAFLSIVILSLGRPTNATKGDVSAALAKITAVGVTFELVTDATLVDFVLPEYLHPAPVPSADEFGLVATHENLGKVLKEVQRTKGRVVLDCTMFAQVAAVLLNGKIDRPALMLARDRVSPNFASLVHRTHFSYVTLAEGRAQKDLLKSPFMNKGQWLIKLTDGAYLGLGTKGVLVDDLPTWIERTKTGLFGEIGQAMTDKSCDMILGQPSLRTIYADLLQTLRLLGELDTWHVYDSPAPQIANPSVRR